MSHSSHLRASALLLSAAALAVTAPAAEALELRWELKHPFRYFAAGEAQDTSVHFLLHEHLVAKAAAANGNGIQTSQILAAQDGGEAIRAFYRDFEKRKLRHKSTGAPTKAFVLGAQSPDLEDLGRSGWAKLPVKLGQTCWDAAQQVHACETDGGADYLLPKWHTVRVWLEGGAKDARCNWTYALPAGGRIARGDAGWVGYKPASGPNDWTSLRQAGSKVEVSCAEVLEVKVPWSPSDNPGLALSVETGGRIAASGNVTVDDVLVVGIGDSFSSGEGNPDVPVRWSSRAAPHPEPGTHGQSRIIRNWFGARNELDSAEPIVIRGQGNQVRSLMFARRESEGVGAAWTDRTCHRSLYSYQFRSALHLAVAAKRKKAVTFVGFACSGAEIHDGILNPTYPGVEHSTTANKTRRTMGQLNRLVNELCLETRRSSRRAACARLKRPIDLMFLSVGGNDIGFAPMVAYAITRGDRANGFRNNPFLRENIGNNLSRQLARMFYAHGAEEGRRKLAGLPDKYLLLYRVLDENGLLPSDRSRLLLTAYPEMGQDEDGRVCGATLQTGQRGMTGNPAFYFSEKDVTELQRLAFDMSDGKLSLNSAMKRFADTYGMTYVDSHRAAFARRGVCATGAASDSASDSAEYSHIPVRVGGNSGPWLKLDPSKFECHANRRRLFRSFDDVYLCANTRHGVQQAIAVPSEINMTLQSLGGPVHPTAEAHTIYADAVAKTDAFRNLLTRR